jgi:uncharacterized phage infection (PIP) family protein YhgE
MREGTAQVHQAVGAAAEAGGKLQRIIESSEEAAGMVNQIAAAATEQSSATDEVNATVSEIAKISLQTSTGARQSAKACGALSDLALDLNELISKFKVEDESIGRIAAHSSWMEGDPYQSTDTESTSVGLRATSGSEVGAP